ncbi:MAG: TraE/TraK family type IV conjugative transfer system protein [Methylococcales bacterium]
MNLQRFMGDWNILQAENRFHRFILIGLLVSNLTLAFAVISKERSVVLVPPNLASEVEITRNSASGAFKESWGLYLAELLGNVTPDNSDFISKAISPLLATDIYQTVMAAMAEQIRAIKIDHVTTTFKPKQVFFEDKSNKVFITGDLTAQGPNTRGETRNRTYEFIMTLNNYRPKLEYIDVYPDDPHTIERLEQIKQQQQAQSAQ